jgi:hypothetical protein
LLCLEKKKRYAKKRFDKNRKSIYNGNNVYNETTEPIRLTKWYFMKEKEKNEINFSLTENCLKHIDNEENLAKHLKEKHENEIQSLIDLNTIKTLKHDQNIQQNNDDDND